MPAAHPGGKAGRAARSLSGERSRVPDPSPGTRPARRPAARRSVSTPHADSPPTTHPTTAAPRLRPHHARTMAYLIPTFDPWDLALSLAVGCLTAYVLLDLSRRVRCTERGIAHLWWVGGAMVTGTGLWAMHFLAMYARVLPIPIGYAVPMTFVSWVCAVGAAAIALSIAARRSVARSRLIASAAILGIVLCITHHIGMAAIELTPGVIWDIPLAATAALFSLALAAPAARDGRRPAPVPHQQLAGRLRPGRGRDRPRHRLHRDELAGGRRRERARERDVLQRPRARRRPCPRPDDDRRAADAGLHVAELDRLRRRRQASLAARRLARARQRPPRLGQRRAAPARDARSADRAAEPPAVRGPARPGTAAFGARQEVRSRTAREDRRAVHRHRRLQAGQRLVRPRGRATR